MEYSLPTPLEEIENHPGTALGIRLFIKRDDLIHPLVQGNKWRKLQPVIEQIRRDGVLGIVSFGGPFSNHLHALAAAGHLFGLRTAGILRGEHPDLDNPTLRDAQNWGMQLFPVSKKEYVAGMTSPAIAGIIRQFPNYYVLPEGGNTADGVRSCAAIVSEIRDTLSIFGLIDPPVIAVPAGTGCTASGVIAGMKGEGRILIFPAAPYGVERHLIRNNLESAGYTAWQNFDINADYVFGRFASQSPELLDFAMMFQVEYGIQLDPIYTSKMMFGIFDLLRRGYFSTGSTVVAIHTGGVQGWRGTERSVADI
jgi:1-aminocyclopropane-1-carboxylate deaminase/D-cysteine desulfhydrase-like pyridoxal-dependent ACC family enzyme